PVTRPPRPRCRFLIGSKARRPAVGDVKNPDLRIRPTGTIRVLDAVGDPPAVGRHLHVADRFQPVEIAALEYRRGRCSRRRLARLRDLSRTLAVDDEHGRTTHGSEHSDHRASHRDLPGDTTLLHTRASSTPNINQWSETILALAGVCTLRRD